MYNDIFNQFDHPPNNRTNERLMHMDIYLTHASGFFLDILLSVQLVVKVNLYIFYVEYYHLHNKYVIGSSLISWNEWFCVLFMI